MFRCSCKTTRTAHGAKSGALTKRAHTQPFNTLRAKIHVGRCFCTASENWQFHRYYIHFDMRARVVFIQCVYSLRSGFLSFFQPFTTIPLMLRKEAKNN